MDVLKRSGPLVILGAMDSEMSLIISQMDEARHYELCGFPVSEGTLSGVPVVAALNQVGMVNTAVLTMLLAEKYKPCFVLSQGTAGSYLEELRTGDIVLGKEIRNINSLNMRPSDCRRLEAITEGKWSELHCCNSDPELMALAASVPYAHGRVCSGSVASCGFWSFDPVRIREIRERYGSDCEEMETYAAAQACTRLGIPFLSVRMISNNELVGESFSPETAVWCQDYILDIVAAIAEKRKEERRKSI